MNVYIKAIVAFTAKQRMVYFFSCKYLLLGKGKYFFDSNNGRAVELFSVLDKQSSLLISMFFFLFMQRLT